MAVIAVRQLATAFGLLGVTVSFLVYLAPLPTFYRIFKKKSTEGFQSIPYSVALFGSTLTLFYGLLKPNGLMIVGINTFGCFIEAAYLTMYLIYAPRKAKVFTAKLIVGFNGVVYGTLVLFAYFFSKGDRRQKIIGWSCGIFSVCVYAAPLSIMKRVIRTKSVEFMPFSLSFFLTLSATLWFFYGLLIRDYFIALPNTLGFLFGIAQMVLYIVYKNSKPSAMAMPSLDQKELAAAPCGRPPTHEGIANEQARVSVENAV